jgi:hypothetical protein
LDGCAGGSAKCGADAPALHARRHGDSQQNDTPDGTMMRSESAAIMGALQPDRMRNADHGGCADRPEIPAVERRRIGHAEQEQLARPKAAALLPGWQRPAPAVGRQHGGRRHAVDADAAVSDAHLLRRDRAHALEQRNARRQVAALRSERGSLGGSGTSTMLPTDNGRGSELARWSSGSTRYQPTATLSDGL